MFKRFLLPIFLFFILIASLISGWFFNIGDFIESIEARSFDFRIQIPINRHQHNKNIVILTVDDNSLDVLEDKYGRWPWDRGVYTKAINFLEKGNPESIVFDLMFIGHQKGFEKTDLELAKTITQNKNIYTAMNFDNRDRENDSPATKLRDDIKAKLENNSKIDFSLLTFDNVRLIMPEILDNTSNVGIINFLRDSDGISRGVPMFFKYQNDYYPYLALKVAANHLSKTENIDENSFVIDKNNYLHIGNRKIQLNKDGLMTINWYGDANTFEWIELWKVLKSYESIQEGKEPLISPDYFKDKIVYIGVTSTSLYDTKSTPLSRIYPGVEIQTTTLNNIIDGTSITRTPFYVDLAISLFLGMLTLLSVLRVRSTYLSSSLAISLGVVYIVASTLILKYFNVWVGVVYEILTIATIFTIAYIIKYILKSRDLEYTYKLATTDGLTGLYNHRYFQEQMRKNIANSKRYENKFSLILIDIDFFKKFNDTYGHQAGDAVLKKVAKMMKKNVRSSDLVARYGGEEMAIILTNTGFEEAVITANKICKAVAEKPFRLTDKLEVNVTISLGVSTYPDHGATSADMIEVADKGLYDAKRNGRNRVGNTEATQEISLD